VYQVDVKAIRGKIMPPVDAEFLKKHGAATEDELRDSIRKHVTEAREAMEQRRLKDEIARHLGDSTPMDLPETQVQRETQSIIYDIVRENARRGVAEGEISKNKDQIFQAANRSAAESVKLRYILHRIADTESINVDDAEFEAHLDAMAMRYGMTPKDLRAGIEKRNAAGEMREQLRRDKVLDYLLANAQLS
jgi:trigger factor